MNRNVLHAIFWLVVISTGCEGPMGPPGPGFGSLDDPSVMPAVVYTYPPMNSTGPYPDFYVNDCGSGICSYYSMIQVRFNKFMDVTSVRRAVRISSSAGGVTTDTNHVASFGGDVVMVTPVDSNGSRMDVRYLLGETYRLSIDSTARDINGNSLGVPFSTTFVPEPYFRVRGFWPEDGAVGVGPTAWLSFEFNSGVDSSITPYLRIEPKAEFNVQFYSYQAHQIYISPGTSWSGLTTYTVLFDSGAPDTAGNRSRETFRSSFTTGGFGILDFYPVDSSQGVSLYSALSIYFTMPLDTASIRAALSIEPPTVHTLRVFPSSRPDHLLIEPDSGWDELTMYTVTFDTNLRSFSGSRLAEPVRSTFTTARFRVTASIDGYWPNGVSRFPYISVGANGPLRESSIPGSVRIVPAVPLNTLMGSNGRYFTVAPAELLAPSTQYTLTIDTTLQTKAGIRLSTPFTFSFRTAPLE